MFSGINTGCAGVSKGSPTSCTPVADAEIEPMAWPNWVAIMEPINVRKRPVMAPMELAISSELPDASSSSPEIAVESPVASGSIVWCQPSSVRSTQSSRLTARGEEEDCVAGKCVASLSQRSEISKALATTLTSLVPIGSDPCTCTNFFAVSRTTFLGSASVLPPAKAANGLIKPAGFIPICSNCF